MRIITTGMFVLATMFAVQKACGQLEKFDITTYISPKGWQKDVKKSYVSYITVNQTTGGFCHIVLYSSVISITSGIPVL